MPDSLERIVDISERILSVNTDSGRVEMYDAMDKMWKLDWDLPDALKDVEWMHKVVSSDPHDALRAGQRILATVSPRITMQPLGSDPDNKKATDKIERALSWHFDNASRRRQTSIVEDLLLSSMLYDEVLAQLVYVPHQIKQMEKIKNKKELQRWEAALRYGPFVIIPRNPRNTFVEYSELMAERVLHRQVQTIQEVVDFWGPNAKELREFTEAEQEENRAEYATVYEYQDLHQRAVWVYPNQLDTSFHELSGNGIELFREDNDIPFLPWVAKVSGTSLFTEPEHQRVPLLYSVYQTGQWETQCALETILASEVFYYAGAPRLSIEGPTADVLVDYGEAGIIAHIPPGHALNDMAPPQLDQNLAQLVAQFQEKMAKSTVPNVLQTGDFPAGAAFATLNLATQSGLKVFAPYKVLTEVALGELFTQMLLWSHYTKDDLVAYTSKSKNSNAEQITIEAVNIDPKHIYINVELTADVPTDQLQRINGATMSKQLGLSDDTAMETIGVTDPSMEKEKSKQEAIEAMNTEIELTNMEADNALAIEKRRIMELSEAQTAAQINQQRMLQQAQQQAQQDPPPDQRETLVERMRRGVNQRRARARGQGFENAQGSDDFNPEMGGSPAAVINPGGTRETQQQVNTPEA
jgi:hypothetical protein